MSEQIFKPQIIFVNTFENTEEKIVYLNFQVAIRHSVAEYVQAAAGCPSKAITIIKLQKLIKVDGKFVLRNEEINAYATEFIRIRGHELGRYIFRVINPYIASYTETRI